MKMHYKKISGFTIVEILIAITVISILVAIVIYAGSNYINRTNEQTLKAELTAAAGAMKNYYNEEGEYPSSIPANADSDRVNRHSSSSTTQFCLYGSNNGTTFKVTNTNIIPVVGACP